MASADDYPGDMSESRSNDGPGKKLSDSDIEALLSGTGTPEGTEDVASVLNQIRASAKPPVAANSEVGAFIDTRPSAPPYIDEVPLAPVADLSKRRSLIQRPAARIAMVAGIALFALTGAYAAGLVDLPGVSDNGEPADVVAAEVQTESTATPAPQPAAQAAQAESEAPTSADDKEFGASLAYGGVSLSIEVESTGDGDTVALDVEGVSPACEAAVESLSGPVSLDDWEAKSSEFEAAAQEIEAACGPELEALLPSLDDPESIEQFLEGFEYELDLPEGLDGLEGFFAGELGALGGFLQGFDAEDIEKFMEEFGLEDGAHPFREFKSEELDDFFDGESLEGFRLDPEQLENFLEDFDSESLDGLLEGFGLNPEELEKFLGGFQLDGESLRGFQLEPGELDEFLEGFKFEELEGLLEGFKFEELEGLLEGFNLDELDGLLEDFGFDAESLEGFDSFFEDFAPEGFEDFFEDKLDEEVGSA